MFTIKSLATTGRRAAATANPATPATEQPNNKAAWAATTATAATPVAKVADVAVAVGGPLQFTAVQEVARKAVLAKLEAHPTVTRTFATRFEGDMLILALAIRGVGTCELCIPLDRFYRNSLADLDALLLCLDGRT